MRIPIDGVIIITGASSGIGAEMARVLVDRATVMVLVARRAERLEALSAELKAKRPELEVDVRPCDLTDPDAARALVADLVTVHGRIDILINNAGMGDMGRFSHADPEKLDRMIAVNVTGLTAITRATVPAMLARKHGGVLNVSSGFGLLSAPFFSTYVGTKHFVTGFTEGLRAELKGTGVVVSQLCPGPVKTEFGQNAGVPAEMERPSPMQISARKCAVDGLRGFERGRALIIPGFVPWFAVMMGRVTPRFIYRALLGVVGRIGRRKFEQREGRITV